MHITPSQTPQSSHPLSFSCLPARPTFSAPSCAFKDSHKGQNQEQAVQLNDFDKAFTENEYAEGLIESRIDVDLTLGEDSRQHLHDAGRNSKDTETGTEDESRANGTFASSAEDVSSIHAMSLGHSEKSDRHGKTNISDAGQNQNPFKGRKRRFDPGSMQPLLAVVVPAISHHPPGDPASLPESTMLLVGDKGSESDTSGEGNPSDHDYVMSSGNDRDSIKELLLKRRKISSQ
ncbi:conserved hypothetical protein [Histoplasma capsulatum H143]|uniref:Uncharacterized protein n=1 Tax=Ajellomyces capsulatus (strain H143) TaxID=544712 RepID=C6HDK7_AJECH|nr:conserved hypothetical protein [Histoplasma capsulatum H143]